MEKNSGDYFSNSARAGRLVRVRHTWGRGGTRGGMLACQQPPQEPTRISRTLSTAESTSSFDRGETLTPTRWDYLIGLSSRSFRRGYQSRNDECRRAISSLRDFCKFLDGSFAFRFRSVVSVLLFCGLSHSTACWCRGLSPSVTERVGRGGNRFTFRVCVVCAFRRHSVSAFCLTFRLIRLWSLLLIGQCVPCSRSWGDLHPAGS